MTAKLTFYILRATTTRLRFLRERKKDWNPSNFGKPRLCKELENNYYMSIICYRRHFSSKYHFSAVLQSREDTRNYLL